MIYTKQGFKHSYAKDVHTHTRTHTRVHTRARANTHTHTHAHTHARKHARTHTHTLYRLIGMKDNVITSANLQFIPKLDMKPVSLQARMSQDPLTRTYGWEVRGRPRLGSGCGGTGAQRRPSWGASGPAVNQLLRTTWPFPSLTVSKCELMTIQT